MFHPSSQDCLGPAGALPAARNYDLQAEMPQHKVAGIAGLSLSLAEGKHRKGCPVLQWMPSGFKARHANVLLTDAHLRPDPCHVITMISGFMLGRIWCG